MTPEKDELLTALAGLPVHDVDSWRSLMTRDRAQAVLARRRRWSNIGRAYSRYLEPALVGSLSIVYLAWALQRVYLLMT
jgi:hypothetical protein